MTIEEDIAFLQRIPTLRELGEAALRILAIGVESRFLATGEVLFTSGEPADGAYIVLEGSFNLKPGWPRARDVVAGPGTLLGESALLVETTRPATATARESSRVMRISRSMFLRMLDGYPDAAQRLRQLIAARSDQWAREMQNVHSLLAGDGKKEE